MKKYSALSLVILLITLLANIAIAGLSAPVLKQNVNGVEVSLSWSKVSDAQGYYLYYAPYPSADPIQGFDVGNVTELKFDLWSGAAYYIAVIAYNQSGQSEYSNIENFNIPLASDINIKFLEAVFPDQESWDRVFVVSSTHPSCNGKDVLSREKFLLAAADFQKFCGSTDKAVNIQELAAFFANVSVETNGAAPGQYDGGLCYVKEVACTQYGDSEECPALCSSYCNELADPWNSSPRCPCGYYGRGALQITNPYNYYETSMEVFGDDRLYQDPDLILEGHTAWQTSLAFWMVHEGGLADSSTTVQGLTTCHKAIAENMDFGKTIEVINGNLECKNPGSSYIEKTQKRVEYYKHYVGLFSKALNMDEKPVDDVKCASNEPPDPDAAKKIRCGVDWTTANMTCGKLCTTSDDCEGGEVCFGDLSLDPCK